MDCIFIKIRKKKQLINSCFSRLTGVLTIRLIQSISYQACTVHLCLCCYDTLFLQKCQKFPYNSPWTELPNAGSIVFRKTEIFIHWKRNDFFEKRVCLERIPEDKIIREPNYSSSPGHMYSNITWYFFILKVLRSGCRKYRQSFHPNRWNLLGSQ